MKFSFSWLKDYLETDLSADEVGDILTDTGLEVESLIDPRKRLGQLSVGEILKVEKHPNADKLKVCDVDSGTGILKIVCGAQNVKNGMKVVVARPGDFEDLALKIKKISNLKFKSLQRFGKNAKNFSKKNFDKKKLLNKLDKLISNMN